MAEITLYPASFDSDYSAYSVSNTDSPIGKGSDNSTYAQIYLKRGSNAETYASWNFDTSSIPDGSTIVSVSCTAKVYISSSNTSYISSRQVQLYSGNTAKGTQKTFQASTAAFTLTCGTWTLSELRNSKIRVYAKRGTSNTNSNYYIRFYGATLTVTYEDNRQKHTLTVDGNGFNVNPSTGEYFDGDSVYITISEATMPKVTVDGADVTSQFVKQALPSGGSKSFTAVNATSVGLSSGSNSISGAVGYTAESPSSTTTNWYGSSSATVDSQYAQYTFDVSEIPSDAIGITVACKVAGKADNSTFSHQSGGKYSVWGLCSNGTAKGEQIHATSTSSAVYTFSDTGSWTRAELDNIQLRHYVGYYGGTTQGITLTITYEIAGGGNEVYVYSLTMDADHVLVVSNSDGSTTLFVKVDGVWKAVSKVWQKKNGAWVEVSDIQTLFNNASNNTNSGYYINNE